MAQPDHSDSTARKSDTFSERRKLFSPFDAWVILRLPACTISKAARTACESNCQSRHDNPSYACCVLGNVQLLVVASDGCWSLQGRDAHLA